MSLQKIPWYAKFIPRAGVKKATGAVEAAPAALPEDEDLYEFSAPSYQNAINLLPGWNHAFPDEMLLAAGAAHLHDDARIHFAVEQFGSLEGKRVLELGPLEGSHTQLLERYGARRIDAIEANKLAYMRCLVSKEIYGLRRARFHLGDFVRGLESPTRYDLVVACGVLYHMKEPLLLLERIAARTDAMFLWTHYFDETEMPPGDHRRITFRAPQPPHEEAVETIEFRGLKMNMHRRSYYAAREDARFCGGMVDHHYWLEKAQLIEALRALGFAHFAFGHETPDHPHGPAFSVFARRG
jgi:hypothetical protein